MKRVIASIICATMFVASLTGCGSQEVSKDNSTQSEGMKEDTASITDVSDMPSWKQDTSPVTLEWFVAYDWASNTFDPVNNLFDQKLLEETGITINWTYGNLEKLNMLITTDSLPDIVTYNVVSTERLTMENNNLLMPLDDLRAQYAPDFVVVEEMMDWYRNEKDGHWYTFASFFYDIQDTEERGGYLSSHIMNYARRDIMKQLDIKEEDMQTKDGFVAALKKVKEAKIEYNGAKVEPFLGQDAVAIAEQFGLDREDKDGNLLNHMKQPEMLEAYLFLNRLYREGLLTDEVFTMDETLRKQKVSSGHVFAGTTHSYMNGKEDLFHTDNEALMGCIGLLKGAEAKTPIITPSTTGGWTGTMITQNCKTPDRAVRLFAYLAQAENSLAAEYGGLDGYELQNGEAVIKPEREKERSEDPQAFSAKYKSFAQDCFYDWVYIQNYEPKKGLNAFKEDEQQARIKYQDGHYYDDKIFSNVKPEGGTELAALQAQIDEYWKQQEPHIIMADSEEKAIERYNQALKKIEELGLQKLDDYKNERFWINKKMMGLEFAWPRNME